MGVRHLYTLLSNKVPNGISQVDMRTEVEDYKRQNDGRAPNIIIDLNNFYFSLCANKHEILLGGRHEIYYAKSCSMFNALKSLGAELIFFIDGPIQPEKISTCLQRRNDRYENGVRILHAINKGCDLSENNRLFNLCTLTTFCQYFISLAEKYGKVYISILNESDQEIANMANKVNALAVVSEDTDFLIFEGTWRYWSARSMNFSTLKTKEFNKNALRSFLGLNSRQMLLFGTLCGNDILQYDQVKNFHARIARESFKKFIPIANAVKQLGSVPPDLKEDDLKKLSELVFSSENVSQGMDQLVKSLNVYGLKNMRFDYGDEVLEKVAKDSSNHIIYHILGNKECILCFMYINLGVGNFVPYHQILSPMIRRMMGVLLKNESEKDTSRKFYYKKSHFKPYELVVETPIFPEVKVPPVLQLLYKPCGHTKFDNLRWDLLCFLISPKLNRDLLLKIPKENLIVVLTLFLLMDNKQITLKDADLLLLACNRPKHGQYILEMDRVKRITGYMAELTFYFQHFYNFIHQCFISVGLRSFTHFLKFDGLYFYYLQNKWSPGDQAFIDSAVDRFKNIRIYSDEFGLISRNEN